MVMLAIQTALLIAIAYILGCIFGCLLHWLFGAPTIIDDTPSAGTSDGGSVAAVAGTATSTAGLEATDLNATRDDDTARADLLGTADTTQREAATSPTPEKTDAAVVEPAVTPEPEPKPAKQAANDDGGKAANLGETLQIDPSDEKAAAADKLGERPMALKAPRNGAPDDLKMVKGIGRQNEGRLNALGTYHFDQIAAWSPDQCKWVGSYLAFAGRIEREDWVNQAKVLARGETTEFSKRASSGQVASSAGKAEKVSADFAGKKPRTMKAPRKAGADKLTQIDGVGNAIEKRLFDIGVFHFDQIAKWTPENSVWVGKEIGFPGRVERENWVGEAKKLVDGAK